MMSSESMFETSLNARHLSPGIVASRYVPHPDFEKLCHLEHTLLLGPRGSGKTTLIKMLFREAIKAWNARHVDEEIANPPFEMIYVPTDTHWSAQLKHALIPLGGHPELQYAIEQCAVALAIARGFVDAIDYLLRSRFLLGSPEEATIVGSFTSILQVTDTPSALVALRLAISRRQSLLSSTVRALLVKERYGLARVEDFILPEWVHIDYHDIAIHVMNVYDIALETGQDTTWALCFDELELAPSWLQRRLLTELRSIDQRILLKLSTSPVLRAQGESEASIYNDFSVISLSEMSAGDKFAFSKRIAETVLHTHLAEPVPLEKYLGYSDYGTVAEHGVRSGGDYDRNGAIYSLIKEQAEVDSSLHELLISKGIDPQNPVPRSTRERDAFYRKLRPILVMRADLLKIKDTGSLKRTRKTVASLHGLTTVLTFADGNPRWLIATMRELIHEGEKNGVRKLSPTIQSRTLESVSTKYLTYIASVPNATIALGTRNVHLVDLLIEWGDYFSNVLLQEAISLDPVTAFTVDRANLPDRLFELLLMGAYYGAIVLLPPESTSPVQVTPDLRCRLTYLLSPKFRLLMRVYKALPLSSLLEIVPRRRFQSLSNMELPFEETT